MPERRSPVGRLVDAAFAFLMRPRVRRVRRWSFLVTLPAGYALSRYLGYRPSLADGALVAVVLAALDAALLLTVVLAGTRLLGAERREVVLDVLMHPAARRLVRIDLELHLTLPRALWRAIGRRRSRREFSYHRGAWEGLGFAIALMPPLATEAVIVDLVLPDGWTWIRLGAAAVHVLGMLYLLEIALAPRMLPHRIAGGVLELRRGAFYRVRVPLVAIAGVERRRERAELPFEVGDAGARLSAGGRVDLVLSLTEPALVERPLGDEVPVTSIAVAADDPAAMLVAIEEERLALGPTVERTPRRAALDASSSLAWGLASS